MITRHNKASKGEAQRPPRSKPTDNASSKMKEIARFLNKLISKKDWGIKTAKGKVVHSNTKAEILDLLRGQLRDRWGQKKHFLPAITRKKYAAHFAGT